MHGMIAFIQERLDEDERDAGLFHELYCPVEPKLRGSGIVWCGCPCPRQLLRQVAVRRQIVNTCQQQVAGQRGKTGRWTVGDVDTRQVLGALAVPYEQHPEWREGWRP